MNKKRKIMLAAIISVVIIYIIFKDRFQQSASLTKIILFAVLFIGTHYLLYLTVGQMQKPKTIYLFIITFLSGLITFVFMIPFVLNLMNSNGGEGGLNEDYSGVFFMISGIITIISFLIAYLFKRKIVSSKNQIL